MPHTITRDDITIGTWRSRDGRTYRAAYIGECVLTGPEHAHLPDAALLDEAVEEAKRAEILAPERMARE